MSLGRRAHAEHATPTPTQPLVDMGPLHMIFVGNPGCGKTSIARLLARLLYDLGAVRKPSFVEVQRTDLVGTHIGTTGPKTRAKIEEARGGVLFVDEAYRLTSTSDKDFGTEALEEIMRDMTSGDPVVIAAGYPTDMRRFLEANEGLSRRFGLTFDFPDFSVGELARSTPLSLLNPIRLCRPAHRCPSPLEPLPCRLPPPPLTSHL